MNETEVAAAIACGSLPSPTRFGNSVLVALRISGTGAAERPSIGETVWRDPLIWLGEEAISRCAGLPVILDHPEGASLDTEEFANRSVGAILLPYVADRVGFQNSEGPDLWGIARLFLDDDQVALIAGQSTSPCVVFAPSDGNQTIVLPDGTRCLVESSPTLIDHLAIVMSGNGVGVWDLGDDDARGIRFDNGNGDNTMKTEEEQMQADKARQDSEEQAKKDAEGGNIDKLLKGVDAVTKCVDALTKRMDSWEKKDAAGNETEEEKTAREAKERADRAREDAELMNHGTHPLTSAQADAARKADAEKAEVQSRADGVANMFGQRAPAPMMGENPFAYRKRMIRQFQRHSPAWKSVDLYAMADEAAFSVAETQIYADAAVASRTPEVEGSDYVKRVTYSEAGHKETRWFGNQTIFKKLSAPTMRVTAFSTPQSRQ